MSIFLIVLFLFISIKLDYSFIDHTSNSMISNQLRYSKCFICYPSTHQHRLLLKFLLKKLTKRAQDIRERKDVTASYSSSEGFHCLIRSILMYDIKSQVNRSASLLCKHVKLENAFKKVLQCNANILNQICEQISSCLSERQYHLCLLTAQVKTIVNNIQNKQSYRSGKSQKPEPKEEIREKQKKEEVCGVVGVKTLVVGVEKRINLLYYPTTQTSISQGISQLRLKNSGLNYESNFMLNP